VAVPVGFDDTKNLRLSDHIANGFYIVIDAGQVDLGPDRPQGGFVHEIASFLRICASTKTSITDEQFFDNFDFS
jgi:hypothetical protein